MPDSCGKIGGNREAMLRTSQVPVVLLGRLEQFVPPVRRIDATSLAQFLHLVGRHRLKSASDLQVLLEHAGRVHFDYYPVLGTLNAPWRVTKVGGDAPQWHEEPTPLGQAVLARRRFLTARTAPAYAGVRLYGDLDRLRSLRAAKHSDSLVHEPYETLHLIQDGLNL